MGAQHGRGEQGGGGRTAEPTAGFVDHEHAVGVAIEGQPDVETAGDDPGLEVALVGWLQRVGGMVGKRAVELAVHDFQRDLRQSLEHRRARRARPSRLRCRRRLATGCIDVASMNDIT